MGEEAIHQILKDLVFEYKKSKDRKVFEIILARLDDLIVYTVKKFQDTHPQYYDVESQDLYHSAIVGMYKGIESALESESGAILQARLIAYMKSEMNTFCRKSSERCHLFKPYELRDPIVPEETVYRELESQLLAERYQKLTEEGVISLLEYKMLVLRYVDNMKIKAIAALVGHSETWVHQKLKDSLNRIRYTLRKKGFEVI